MNPHSDAYDRLSSVLQQELGIDLHELGLGAVLADVADSLGMVNVLAAMEDDLGVRISSEQGAGLRTVSDLLQLVDQLVGARRAAA